MSNSEWIECNLPWFKDVVSRISPYPDLSKKEKEFFGKSVEECRELLSEVKDEFYRIEENAFAPYKKVHRSSEENNRILEAYANISTNEEEKKVIFAVLEYRKFLRSADDWRAAQPEIIEWHKQADIEGQKRKELQKISSFVGAGLNQAGTLIEVENADKTTTQYLIGDINEQGGVCNDCRGFSQESIVKRYKKII